MFVPAATSSTSRTVHVVTVASVTGIPGMGNPDRWSDTNTAVAACGITAHPSRGSVGEATEICLKCRAALEWPFVVTWTKDGTTYTTDFRKS